MAVDLGGSTCPGKLAVGTGRGRFRDVPTGEGRTGSRLEGGGSQWKSCMLECISHFFASAAQPPFFPRIYVSYVAGMGLRRPIG